MILGIGGHEYVLATKVKVDPGKKKSRNHNLSFERARREVYDTHFF